MVPRDEDLEIFFGVLPRLVRVFFILSYTNTPHLLTCVRTFPVFKDSKKNKISQPIDRMFLDIIPTVSPLRVYFDTLVKYLKWPPTRNNRHVSGDSEAQVSSVPAEPSH
jgi:hypothetical protein